MAKVSTYEPGIFSWIDLNTRDAAAAKRFYGAAFGWETIDNPTDQGGVYTQFTSGGQKVAGMGEMGDDMKAAGVPPQWNCYVTVADVDAAAARAQELGAQLMLPPMQVMDAGRMAILIDPTGARLSLWQAGEHVGSELVNEPVSLCWNELVTRDVDVASLVQRITRLNVFDLEAFQILRFTIGETGISFLGTQLISRFQQAIVFPVLD